MRRKSPESFRYQKRHPNSFRFLHVWAIDGQRWGQVLTQDRRRRRNVVTGVCGAIKLWSDGAQYARDMGCSIIVRTTSANLAKEFRRA